MFPCGNPTVLILGHIISPSMLKERFLHAMSISRCGSTLGNTSRISKKRPTVVSWLTNQVYVSDARMAKLSAQDFPFLKPN